MAIAIVSGALANKPFNGGEAWVRLSWVLGLTRLGFETYFVERLAAGACVDEEGRRASFVESANLAYFERVIAEFNLRARAGLLGEGAEGAGLARGELLELAAEAEIIFDLSGHLSSEPLLHGPKTRVYVDLDPGFTQAWHADDSLQFGLGAHDRYVTVGLNVGGLASRIPTAGIEWIPTLPPVLLSEWPVSNPAAESGPRFTSVGTWRSPFGGVEIGGKIASLKHHQLRRIIELPELVPEASFEIALDIHPADSGDLEALRRHGWTIVDPRSAAGSPCRFRRYLGDSTAELSVAQGVYAESASGWFSDRTAAYLACGRPAVVQETGLGEALPTGRGLLTFSALEEAVERVREVMADPSGQAGAARRLAERYLDSDRVLGELLGRIGLGG